VRIRTNNKSKLREVKIINKHRKESEIMIFNKRLKKD